MFVFSKFSKRSSCASFTFLNNKKNSLRDVASKFPVTFFILLFLSTYKQPFSSGINYPIRKIKGQNEFPPSHVMNEEFINSIKTKYLYRL